MDLKGHGFGRATQR